MTNAAKSILVIDDEDSICLAFRRFFSDRGWDVRTAASAADGLAAFHAQRPDVVFLDVRLPDRSGLETLQDIADGETGIIVITAYGGLDTVAQALRGRAYDYLVKPLDLDKAAALANRIWRSRASRAKLVSAQDVDAEILVGKSPAIQEAYKLIVRAAEAASPVLIQGETGTGKELAARAIHQFSTRRDGPFVAVNCGAIPENLIESELFGHVRGAFTGAEGERTGRFEAAHGGTLLLDEVGELPPAAQVKLLRVLDSGIIERVGSSETIQLDVRVVAATNRDLSDEVRRKRFRQDLFYRLAVLRISLPPLRARDGDIELLANHFLRRQTAPGGPAPTLSKEALDRLLRHSWPGNVRELKNAVEHALAVAPDRAVTLDDLPTCVVHGDLAVDSDDSRLREAVVEYLRGLGDASAAKHQRVVEQVERAMIDYALKRCGGKQAEAAEFLGLHRNTLRNKLRETSEE